MRRKRRRLPAGTVAGVLALAVLTRACGTSMEPSEATVDLVFVPSSLSLDAGGEGQVSLRNEGSAAAGPIQLLAGAVTGDAGPASDVRLQVTPEEVATLNPGRSQTISLAIDFASAPAPGSYQASLAARLGADTAASLSIDFSVNPPPASDGRTVSITGGPTSMRQGDVVAFEAEVRDSAGTVVDDATIIWSVVPGSAGLLTAEGRFVGYSVGEAAIVATESEAADTVEISITARGLSGALSVVGQGRVSSRYTSDLWVHGDHAYTGTWSCRGDVCGDRLFVWDISDPTSPQLTDSVAVDAGTVNDVKIRSDGAIGVITHEASSDARNGVTLLDLGDPAHPTVITRFTAGLESGVHNVWVEGDYVYVALDGTGNGLRILDISDPSDPFVVASFTAATSFLHDVYVRDGLAFLSYWDAGLIILDVGNGIVGGSPTDPMEVGRIQTAGGDTHNAWYWPATGYVLVGEEDFSTPGALHVVDARDLSNPQEVATLSLAGATPHNFWLDEDRAILYAAWYENGVVAIDVSGELLGALERQGRVIAMEQYGEGVGCGAATATCTWAPQLHRGDVYVSDLNTGLWVLRPDF